MAVVVLALISVVLAPGRAAAHAELESTEPSNGAQLAVAPSSVVLRFTEPVQLVGDAVEVVDGAGQLVAASPTADGATVRVDLPQIGEGTYLVDWQVVSQDGHPIAGSFVFSVGTAPPDAAAGPPVTRTPGEPLSLVLARAATYLGLALVLGAWLFAIVCRPGAAGRRTVREVVLGGASLLTVGAGVRLAVEADRLGGGITDLWDVEPGRAWWLLLAAGLASFSVSELIERAAGSRLQAVGWVVAAAGAGWLVGEAGHAASGRWPTVAMVATVVHVAAVSAWIGGVATLAVVAFRARGDAGATAPRVSQLATVAMPVTVLTGVVQSVRQLRSWDAVLDSPFGRSLLVKVGVVVLVVACGALARRVVGRGGRTEHVRRTVALEAGIGVIVFGMTGWLAGASPVPDRSAPPPASTSTTTVRTDAGTVTIAITPGAVGPNRIDVTAVAADGVTPAQDVVVRFANAAAGVSALEIESSPVAPGVETAASATLPFAGLWDVTVDARFGEFDQASFTTQLVISD